MSLNRWVLVLFAAFAAAVFAVPAAASAASVTLDDPPDNTTVISPQGGGVPSNFTATREMSGCTINESYQGFYIDIEFPGESQYYPVATNLSDETTIQGGTLLYPGVYHWKGTLYCGSGPNHDETVESEVRTYTILDGSIPPNVSFTQPQAQRVTGLITISFTCDAPCHGDLAGHLKVPGHKPFDLHPQSFGEIPAGTESDLQLKYSNAARDAAKAAVKDGKTPKATIDLNVENSVGTKTTSTQKIKLER